MFINEGTKKNGGPYFKDNTAASWVRQKEKQLSEIIIKPKNKKAT